MVTSKNGISATDTLAEKHSVTAILGKSILVHVVITEAILVIGQIVSGYTDTAAIDGTITSF